MAQSRVGTFDRRPIDRYAEPQAARRPAPPATRITPPVPGLLTTADVYGPVRRVKTPEERSAKQTRVAQARVGIDRLSTAFAAQKGALNTHIFRGERGEGDKPTGLHAYTAQRLPAGVHEASVEGNRNKVHILTWGFGDSPHTKKSTMLPCWMPVKHAQALFALQVLGSDDVDHPAVAKEDIKTYVKRGTAVNLEKKGDTVYPVIDGVHF